MLKLLILFINYYQEHKPSSLYGVCIYTPTCSQYAKQVLIKYGIFIGSFKALKRIFKCNGKNQGGFDFP